jgi:2-desacetyl-2-hydroxyethyl bacteriochlorophyllide A dehydrogenase
MRAVVVDESGQVTVETVADPSPAAGQVIVEVHRCGICGTDRHLVAGDHPFAVYPVIPGHEVAGRIAAVGEGVTQNLRVGQLVAVDPSRSCGYCEQCRAGWPNLCPRKGGHGSRLPGGVAEFVAVDGASCEPFADDFDPALAALTEPLSCVLHGLDNLGPVIGQRALVYGAGPIGLMMCVLLAQSGVRSLSLVEQSAARRSRADGFGVSARAACADELDEERRYNVVVDATGSPAAISDGLGRLSPAGRFLILGVAPAQSRVEFSPFEVNWRELKIIGSMAVRNSFGRAARLLESGLFAGSGLVTSAVPLPGFEQALAHLADGEQLKIQIAPHAVAERDSRHAPGPRTPTMPRAPQ